MRQDEIFKFDEELREAIKKEFEENSRIKSIRDNIIKGRYIVFGTQMPNIKNVVDSSGKIMPNVFIDSKNSILCTENKNLPINLKKVIIFPTIKFIIPPNKNILRIKLYDKLTTETKLPEKLRQEKINKYSLFNTNESPEKFEIKLMRELILRNHFKLTKSDKNKIYCKTNSIFSFAFEKSDNENFYFNDDSATSSDSDLDLGLDLKKQTFKYFILNENGKIIENAYYNKDTGFLHYKNESLKLNTQYLTFKK